MKKKSLFVNSICFSIGTLLFFTSYYMYQNGQSTHAVTLNVPTLIWIFMLFCFSVLLMLYSFLNLVNIFAGRE